MAGWSSTRVTCSCSAAFGSEERDPVGSLRVAVVEQPPGLELGPHRSEQTARGRLDRHLELGLALGVVDRHRPHEVAPQVDVAQGPGSDDPVQALRPGLGVPGQRVGPQRPSGGAGLRGDDDVGRGQLVEAPDDLVAGRLGQAEGRDQRGHADDGAEHGEHGAGGSGEEAGQALREQVAQLQLRARRLLVERGGLGGGGRGLGDRGHGSGGPSCSSPGSTSRSTPSMMRTRRCAAGDVLVVGDDRQGQRLPREALEQLEHALGVLRVQVARRLVAQQQARMAHERTGDGGALLLAAREAGGQELGPIGHADAVQRGHGPVSPALAGGAHVQLGQHHVLDDRAVGEQVEGLEDEADPPAAQAGPAEVVELRGVDTLEAVRARRVPVEQPEDVEQRRLARTRRSDDGDPLTRPDREVDLPQRVHRRLDAEDARHPHELHDRSGHPGPDRRRLLDGSLDHGGGTCLSSSAFCSRKVVSYSARTFSSTEEMWAFSHLMSAATMETSSAWSAFNAVWS